MRKVPHLSGKSLHSGKKLAYTKDVNARRNSKLRTPLDGYRWMVQGYFMGIQRC
jgi:hypothetical protein